MILNININGWRPSNTRCFKHAVSKATLLALGAILFVVNPGRAQQLDVSKMTSTQLEALSKEQLEALSAKDVLLKIMEKSGPGLYDVLLAHALRRLAYIAPEPSPVEVDAA